jgi:uncharacterized damage-inducible protein DinB
MSDLLSNLRKRFKYNRSANERMINVIQTSNYNSDSVTRLMSHIFNAHWVWLDRMFDLQDRPVPGVWDVHEHSEWTSHNEQSFITTLGYLNEQGGAIPLDQTIRYENSKGIRFENSRSDIFDHILLHSMYHRGQVAQLLSKAEVDPPVTDYIMMHREALD